MKAQKMKKRDQVDAVSKQSALRPIPLICHPACLQHKN